MKTSIFYSIIFLASMSFGAMAQETDPILFSVQDNEVRVSEFEYIYNKNNAEGANYSPESLNEYLDLYTKFKLKVERAKELKLDTIKSLQNELAGYRRQLADSYLVDKEVHNKLTDEVFKRMQFDREAAHIHVSLPTKSSELAINKASAKIRDIKEMLDKGAEWSAVVKEHSQDKYSAPKDGNMGYFTAMLPSGFYEFENALYNTKVGEVSDIIRSKVGYHIVKPLAERPARGEMEVAHIFIKNPKNPNLVKGDHRKLIDSLYQILLDGGNFDDLAKKYSDDKKTAAKGGYLGWFGIRKYESNFENAAFALENNGDITEPFETANGLHIVKRYNKRDFSDFKRVKGRIENLLTKDDRLKIAKKALVKDIQKQSGYTENAKAFKIFRDSLDQEFYSFKWQKPAFETMELFRFGDKHVATNNDFAEYCKKNTRKRLAFKKSKDLEESMRELYEEFVELKALEYEEKNLEMKYPEFKSLMREYEEGILLFEITKQEVWDKASKDTVGLQKFFEKNKANYNWEKRAKLYEYEVKSTDEKIIKDIRKKAKKSSREELLAMFNTPENQLLNIKEKTLEKSDESIKDIKWKEGHISDANIEDGKSVFVKVLETIPAGPKKLNEARGYIIADYQEFLEKEWIAYLKDKYTIQLDQKVFDSLIRS